MKLVSKLAFALALSVPGLALAHPGHAPLAGLPDVLLHHPWVAGLALAVGVVALRSIAARRVRARSRRR
jgi:hypothetical protein